MESTAKPTTLNTRRIVISGILGAIAILLGWTGIGYIPVPNLAGSATIMHIPAIVGGVLEGWLVGGIIGLVFGLSSFARATFPLFKNPFIAIVPRLFIGVTAYFAYVAVQRSNEYVALVLSGVAGAVTSVFIYVVLKPATTAVLGSVVALGEQGLAPGDLVPWLERVSQATDLSVALASLAGALVAVILAYVTLKVSIEYLALVTASIAGTLTNTILVLVLAGLFNYIPWVAMPPILIMNAVPESIIAVILVVAIVTAWKQVETGSGEAKM